MKIGLALSGGGSRAIAFHLGCLKALNELDILNKVEVISSVSGGSVIAALYVYSDDSFDEFEKKVNSILKEGITFKIILEYFKTGIFIKSFLTMLVMGSIALLIDLINISLKIIVMLRGPHSLLKWTLHPPLRRWYSRTTAFEKVLEEYYFGEKTIDEVKRNNLKIVINATELRTGTSFQFSNVNSGCWKYGRLDNSKLRISKAVAASAAYPALLPALTEKFIFKRNEIEEQKFVILTDGGVYDNAGINCLEPNKNPDYSTNSFELDYIICCDAGPGEFSGKQKPFWWWNRMIQSYETTLKQVQNASFGRLHRYKDDNKIKGFILSYLGQDEERIPEDMKELIHDEDLMKDRDVLNYPTDFSGMPKKMRKKIIGKGEKLTIALIKYYCPELIS